MVINFYNCKDDPRTVSKTLGDVVKSVADAKIYDGCSIISPVMLLRYDASVVGCNYMHIPEWSRYYHITDISVDNGRQMYISGSIDPLYTYAEQIKACSGNCIRNEGIGAPTYVPDSSLPLHSASDYFTSISLGYLGTPVSQATPNPRYYFLATK